MSTGTDIHQLSASLVVRDEVIDRVNVAHGMLTEGLGYLKVKHMVIFPTSWLIFYLLGRWFFDIVLGRYHATSSRYWAWGCKIIFLLTFVSACNLLNLMIAEVYGFMHPTLRTVAWTCTLSLLCVLLNNIIPFLMATSMGRTLGFPRMLAAMLGAGTVVVFQIWFWFIAETLISDKSETWKDHSSVNVIWFLYQQLLLKDLEHSVAIISMMGVFTSALIAGFATISFPLDSLMIFRGVNLPLLRTKERTHIQVLRTIAERKRSKLIALKAQEAESGPWQPGWISRGLAQSRVGSVSSSSLLSPTADRSSSSAITSSSSVDDLAVTMKNRKGQSKPSKRSVRASISLSLGKITKAGRKGEYKELFKDLARTNSFLHQCYRRCRDFMQKLWLNLDAMVDRVVIGVASMWARQGYQAYHWRLEKDAGDRDPTTGYDIEILEQISEDIFLDIVHSHELREQAEFAQTRLGQFIWGCGVFLSFVGVVRLIFALIHVTFGVVHDEDETFFADIMMWVLNMDRAEWELSANLFIIFLLGAFQVRAFLGSMMISARLGFLSTNTELYALMLAYLSGFYFVASVVLLRIQLPIEYRKGVTLALGQFSFDYFEWLFDRIYIGSSTVSMVCLWLDAKRKAKASQRFFDHDT